MMSSLNSKKRAFSWVVSLHIHVATMEIKHDDRYDLIDQIRIYFLWEEFFIKGGSTFQWINEFFVELIFEWHIIFVIIFYTGT